MNKQMYLVTAFVVLVAATPTVIKTMIVPRHGNPTKGSGFPEATMVPSKGLGNLGKDKGSKRKSIMIFGKRISISDFQGKGPTDSEKKAARFLDKMNEVRKNIKLKEINNFLTEQNMHLILKSNNLAQKIESLKKYIQRLKKNIQSFGGDIEYWKEKFCFLEDKNIPLIEKNKRLVEMNVALSEEKVGWRKIDKKNKLKIMDLFQGKIRQSIDYNELLKKIEAGDKKGAWDKVAENSRKLMLEKVNLTKKIVNSIRDLRTDILGIEDEYSKFSKENKELRKVIRRRDNIIDRLREECHNDKHFKSGSLREVIEDLKDRNNSLRNRNRELREKVYLGVQNLKRPIDGFEDNKKLREEVKNLKEKIESFSRKRKETGSGGRQDRPDKRRRR